MRMKRTAMAAGILGLAAVSTGCGLAGPESEDTVSYDVTDKVAAVKVEADAGSVEVVESDRQGIRVTERLVWRKNKPETSHPVQGDTLALSFKCPTTWGLGAPGVSCEVSYQVEVPKGLSVKASTDSGKVTLKNLSGPLEAETDSGAIEAGGLSGKRVVTRTDSGNMTVAFTGQPDKVESATDSGRTVIHVPHGPYRIEAQSGSGNQNITAARDPASQRVIALSSDSGDLEVVTP
ncbi:DUF4097 family beta strand repeat-containing protein [Nonomuraea sp. NPDC046802]|uniref:DUF4097 family beta strand repeat-containing protein n=1 Tax=Nonomuraea sp. NPDC046802 TaxID=3154919 RepID=UPI0033ED5C8E